MMWRKYALRGILLIILLISILKEIGVPAPNVAVNLLSNVRIAKLP